MRTPRTTSATAASRWPVVTRRSSNTPLLDRRARVTEEVHDRGSSADHERSRGRGDEAHLAAAGVVVVTRMGRERPSSASDDDAGHARKETPEQEAVDDLLEGLGPGQTAGLGRGRDLATSLRHQSYQGDVSTYDYRRHDSSSW